MDCRILAINKSEIINRNSDHAKRPARIMNISVCHSDEVCHYRAANNNWTSS